MQKIIRGLIILSLAFCVYVSQTWAGSGLVKIDVEVANRSSSEFSKSLNKACKQALVMLSGNPEIMAIPQIHDSVKNVKNYLVSYSFQRKETSMILHVVFDASSIKNLLEQAGQTLWDGSREPTLVIISVETPLGRSVLSSLEGSLLISSLQRAASQRGLEVIFPVMDIQDQSALQKNEKGELNVGLFIERYHVATILFGDISTDPTSDTQINWLLESKGTHFKWVTQNSDMLQAINLGMDKFLETLANQTKERFHNEMPANVFLEVNGINGLQDYVKVVSTISHLQGVIAVGVKDMNIDRLTLKVKVLGGVDALSQILNRSVFLTPDRSNMLPSFSSSDLIYHWVKSKTAFIEPSSLPQLLPQSESDEVAVVRPYHHSSKEVSRVPS